MSTGPNSRRERPRPGVAKRILSALVEASVSVRTSTARTMIPRPLRTLGYRILPQHEFEKKTYETSYERTLAEAQRSPLRTSVKLGILKDYMLRCGYYEAACMELGVPYQLVDIAAPDWIRQVEDSGCSAFLAWPSHINSVSKDMFDERLCVLTQELGRVVFPSYKALWLYESKRRTHDWLQVRGVPHPETWVFFEREVAEDFVASAEYPLVYKTDLGSEATGVEIVRTRHHAEALVRRCFGKGYLPRRHDSRDPSWGCMLLQTYIPDAKEWRMVRVGNSFFGHQKLKRGDFHSGTHLVGWYRPPDELLDFTKDITDREPFLSMDLDVFETADGRYLVNELQAVFGSKNRNQMCIDGKPGRFVRDEEHRQWRFEEGDFCGNKSCNMRVMTLLELLGQPLSLAEV